MRFNPCQPCCVGKVGTFSFVGHGYAQGSLPDKTEISLAGNIGALSECTVVIVGHGLNAINAAHFDMDMPEVYWPDVGNWVQAGGRLLLVSEFYDAAANSGFGFGYADWTRLNAFLSSITSTITGSPANLDEGSATLCSGTAWLATISTLPLTAGLTELGYAASSVANGGTPVAFTTTTSSIILAAESIGQGWVMLSGDGNIFLSGCTGSQILMSNFFDVDPLL